MSTKRESPGSDVFVLTCHDCGAVLRVTAGSGFSMAETAARKRGWTFHRLDRCKACTKTATAKPTKTPARRPTAAKR